MQYRYRFGCLGAVLLVALSSPARAQVTIPEEYGKLIKHRGEITAFGNEGFGDKIDIGSGGLQIVQTDIDLPGNNAVPVRLGRRFVAGDKHGGGFFGVWSLDVPYIHGIFGNHPNMPKGWRVPESVANQYKRCSLFSAPPDLLFQGEGHYLADEYWHGSFLYLPGAGDQELLQVVTTDHVPTDGNTYPIVTKEGAAVRCVALASTSESGSQGEGFEVVTPDGLIYTLNQMVSRTNETISKPVDQNSVMKSGESNKQTASRPTPSLAVNFTLPRIEVRLYPTKVADRLGNYVTYTWSATNPQQLLQMSSSDGRTLTFTTVNGAVNVSDGSRTWTYSSSGGIDTVTLPDGSAWHSSLASLFDFEMHTNGDGCTSDVVYRGTPPILTGSVTSPGGATAVFTMEPVRMGRSWVPLECVSYNDVPLYAKDPKGFFNLAVTNKKITGPGLPAAGLSWAHAYGAPNGCWLGAAPTCTSASPTTRTVTVTDPEGIVNRYIFGNRYAVDEGLQLRVDYGWNGTSALRTVETTYAAPDAAQYSSLNGFSPRQRGDVVMSKLHPQRQVTTTQQGRTFTWQVATGCNGYSYCFDAYARPTKVVKSSSP